MIVLVVSIETTAETITGIQQALAALAPRNTSIACYEASEIPFPIARG